MPAAAPAPARAWAACICGMPSFLRRSAQPCSLRIATPVVLAVIGRPFLRRPGLRRPPWALHQGVPARLRPSSPPVREPLEREQEQPEHEQHAVPSTCGGAASQPCCSHLLLLQLPRLPSDAEIKSCHSRKAEIIVLETEMLVQSCNTKLNSKQKDTHPEHSRLILCVDQQNQWKSNTRCIGP